MGVTRSQLGDKNIGSFQKKVLDIMKQKEEWTVQQIATAMYGHPIPPHSTEYAKISRALRALRERGITEQIKIEVKWKLKP